MLTRRTLIAALASAPAIAALTNAARAAEPEIFNTDGVAINGYDAVAYFTQSAPIEGSAEHELDWNGATWRFSSAENKTAFEVDPAAYAPQYGGYCAYAVSKGGTATTSPDAWRVVDGKLYLNYNRTVQGIWSEDIPGHISKADANWPAVLGR